MGTLVLRWLIIIQVNIWLLSLGILKMIMGWILISALTRSLENTRYTPRMNLKSTQIIYM